MFIFFELSSVSVSCLSWCTDDGTFFILLRRLVIFISSCSDDHFLFTVVVIWKNRCWSLVRSDIPYILRKNRISEGLLTTVTDNLVYIVAVIIIWWNWADHGLLKSTISQPWPTTPHQLNHHHIINMSVSNIDLHLYSKKICRLYWE